MKFRLKKTKPMGIYKIQKYCQVTEEPRYGWIDVDTITALNNHEAKKKFRREVKALVEYERFEPIVIDEVEIE